MQRQLGSPCLWQWRLPARQMMLWDIMTTKDLTTSPAIPMDDEWMTKDR
jgi:hypothetical protein